MHNYTFLSFSCLFRKVKGIKECVGIYYGLRIHQLFCYKLLFLESPFLLGQSKVMPKRNSCAFTLRLVVLPSKRIFRLTRICQRIKIALPVDNDGHNTSLQHNSMGEPSTYASISLQQSPIHSHKELMKLMIRKWFEPRSNIKWLWRWLRHRLSKRQSLTTVLLRTPITQMIFFSQGTYDQVTVLQAF